MTCKLDVDPEARDQIRALPTDAAKALAKALAVLELVPWNGLPYNADFPDGNVRELLKVMWVG